MCYECRQNETYWYGMLVHKIYPKNHGSHFSGFGKGISIEIYAHSTIWISFVELLNVLKNWSNSLVIFVSQVTLLCTWVSTCAPFGFAVLLLSILILIKCEVISFGTLRIPTTFFTLVPFPIVHTILLFACISWLRFSYLFSLILPLQRINFESNSWECSNIQQPNTHFPNRVYSKRNHVVGCVKPHGMNESAYNNNHDNNK